MADVRINALSTTATSAASDDYLALDGSANGTRKILATNIAQNVTDVTFGSGGPSAKSSIAARAARQGLVFDGTAGATVSGLPVANIFSLAIWARVDSFTDYRTLVYGGSNSIAIYANSAGRIVIDDGALKTSSTTITAGQLFLLTVVKASGASNYSIRLNGGSEDTSVAVGAALTAALLTHVGTGAGFNNNSGYVYPYAYNRALSAAEVVSLYEAGVPSGADYGASGVPASNTSIVTGANSDFSSDTGYWTKGNGATISGGKCNLTGGTYANIFRASIMTSGKKFRIVFTVSTADAALYISDGGVTSLAAGISGTGTKTVEVTGGPAGGIQIVSPAGTAVIDDLLIYPLGLLLAPDAAQAGGGLTWYDTSGNAANITLPASGVTWNVPSSLKTASGWTFGGTVLAGTAAAQGILASKNGSRFISLFSTSGGNGAVLFDSTSALRFGTSTDETGSGFSELARLTASGNVLIGTTTDSANGKLQLATHTTSAGGIGFGTDVSLYRSGSGGNLATNAGTFTGGVGAGYFSINTSGSSPLVLGANGVEGARFDGSTQNLVMASGKALRLGNAYTASVVVPTGYVTIQDSTGTTYKIPVGT